MKTIPEYEYEKLLLVELENERLKSENSFLHKKITQYKIEIKDKEIAELIFLAGKKINEMDLNVRAINCLQNADIMTLADLKIFLSKNDMSDLLKFRFMGKKSYYEICKMIFKTF